VTTTQGWIDESVVGELPSWLTPVVTLTRTVTTSDLTRFPPPPEGGRSSAVLILFGDGAQGSDAAEPHPDLLIIERAHDMRSHAGQPAFPGGAIDDTDSDAIAAALREAQEETGIDPAGIVTFGRLPDLFLPPSGFVVTPVLGWWREPSPFAVVDPAEVASVHRIPVRDLVEPSHRLRVLHPSGYLGPAFRVHDLLIWGFTSGLIDRLLALAGWAQPWDESIVAQLDPTS
jgi:8-oxo-dGTP pyrophosphatase MutT (NUDIX family)